MFYGDKSHFYPGLLYGIINRHTIEDGIKKGFTQMMYQIIGAGFITLWNVVATSLICILVRRIVDLRMNEEDLEIGDDAVHGEEAYALWGDGERCTPLRSLTPKIPSFCRPR